MCSGSQCIASINPYRTNTTNTIYLPEVYCFSINVDRVRSIYKKMAMWTFNKYTVKHSKYGNKARLTHSRQMKLHHNTWGRQCSSCRSLDWLLSCRREILQWQLRKARIWKILAMSCCDGSSPFHSYTILLLPGVESTCSLHYHFLFECRSLRLTHPDTWLPGTKQYIVV